MVLCVLPLPNCHKLSLEPHPPKQAPKQRGFDNTLEAARPKQAPNQRGLDNTFDAARPKQAQSATETARNKKCTLHALLGFCLIFLPLLLPLLRFIYCIGFPLTPVQHIQPGENTMTTTHVQ